MARGVLSFSGRCSSSARTIQLAMIVNNTMYSNGVHTNTVKDRSHSLTNNNNNFISQRNMHILDNIMYII